MSFLITHIQENDSKNRHSTMHDNLLSHIQKSILPSNMASNMNVGKKNNISLDFVLSALAQIKAQDQVVIPLHGKSSLVDYMVIVSGTSDRHVRAIADNMIHDLRDNGYGHYIPELGQDDAWVLLDLGAIIIHVFKQETREIYALEKMWSVSDAKQTIETVSF